MTFITTKEAAEKLSIKTRNGKPSTKGTKKLLRKMGVEPYPLGSGAGLGDRWNWSEIVEKMEKLRTPKKTRKQRTPKPKAKDYFTGRPPEKRV